MWCVISDYVCFIVWSGSSIVHEQRANSSAAPTTAPRKYRIFCSANGVGFEVRTALGLWKFVIHSPASHSFVPTKYGIIFSKIIKTMAFSQYASRRRRQYCNDVACDVNWCEPTNKRCTITKHISRFLLECAIVCVSPFDSTRSDRIAPVNRSTRSFASHSGSKMSNRTRIRISSFFLFVHIYIHIFLHAHRTQTHTE